VLDLRNDPGGLLDAAVAISAAFLPENVTVVSTNGQLPESKFVYKAAPEFYQRRAGSDPLRRLPAAAEDVPLVVLVNEGSASASEIVAGALQDHKRATVLGSQTFGKGSVQTVRPLGPDTGLKLTTARYYTPSGKSIQAKGIVPDVLVDESEEGNLFSLLRTREADLDKHLGSGQGPEVKDPRARRPATKPASAEEEAKKAPPTARCPSSAATRTSSWCRPQPAEGPPGAGQQDAGRREQGREEGELTPAAGPRSSPRKPAPAGFCFWGQSAHDRRRPAALLAPHPAGGDRRRRPGAAAAGHALVIGAGGLGSPVACTWARPASAASRWSTTTRWTSPTCSARSPTPWTASASPRSSRRAAIARHQPAGAGRGRGRLRADAACSTGWWPGRRGGRLLRQLRHPAGRQRRLRAAPQAAGVGRRDPLRRPAGVFDTRDAASPCYACVFPPDSAPRRRAAPRWACSRRWWASSARCRRPRR
jgi:hypothetical protein